MTFRPVNSLAPFIPTSTYFPQDFQQFRIKFLEIYRDIANASNTRDNGIHDLEEFVSGQQWFTAGDPQKKRLTFRKVFNLGAIAAGGTSTTAHGLTGNPLVFTYIGGTAITNVVDQRPIPFASVTAVNQQIQVQCTATNLVVTNGAASPAITSAIIVLEYLKN